MAELPAVFANQFGLIVNQTTTRITFGDEPMKGIPLIQHTAVIMKTVDAKMLATLLLKMIAENEGGVLLDKALGG